MHYYQVHISAFAAYCGVNTPTSAKSDSAQLAVRRDVQWHKRDSHHTGTHGRNNLEGIDKRKVGQCGNMMLFQCLRPLLLAE